MKFPLFRIPLSEFKIIFDFQRQLVPMFGNKQLFRVDWIGANFAFHQISAPLPLTVTDMTVSSADLNFSTSAHCFAPAHTIFDYFRSVVRSLRSHALVISFHSPSKCSRGTTARQILPGRGRAKTKARYCYLFT